MLSKEQMKNIIGGKQFTESTWVRCCIVGTTIGQSSWACTPCEQLSKGDIMVCESSYDFRVINC